LNQKQFYIIVLLIIGSSGALFTSCIKESNINTFSDTLKIARIYQPDGIYGKDAIIESILPDKNFGGSINLSVFSWTSGGSFDNARFLLKFDLTDISTQKKISSAKLNLYWISYDNLTEQTGDNAFSIYRITQAWNENLVTWKNQPLINDLQKVNVPKSTSTNQSYTDIDVTAFVQEMIKYPSENHGFMFKLDEEFPYKLVILASSDYSVMIKRPKLVVYY